MLTIKRLWRLSPGNRLLFLCAVAATGLATAFSLLPPLVVRFTVDNVLGGNPYELPKIIESAIKALGGLSVIAERLWLCAIAIILLTLFQSLFSYFKSRWVAIASERITEALKNNLYDHLQKLPYDYHVKAMTGDLIQRCTSDVETVRRFLASQLIEIGRSIFILVLSVYVMASLNVKLTLISLIFIPILLAFSFIFFKKLTSAFLLADQKEGELSTVLQENLSGVRVVRAYGRQAFEANKFEQKNSEFRNLISKLIGIMACFWSVSDALCIAQTGLILFFGVKMVIAGDMTLGTLLVFTIYEGMLLWPMRNLGRLLSDAGKMSVSLERLYDILNSPLETDAPDAIEPDLQGDIVFENVVFGYEKNNPVLKGMSFRVKPGETVAILGATGSGKSTIINLLLRLYDYSAGSIKINGAELRSIKKKWLRRRVGIVLQEPFLFSKTICENIRMADHNILDAEIYEAARIASVHHVIEGFENGYKTVVGEKGVTLSGGQKQRVAIARAIIKNCDILIFDDSLSAVDTETDSRIRNALKERRKDVTTFIISQRIATLMEADRIFVLESGRLSDQGTHGELIARDGLYKRIWEIQNLPEDSFDMECEVIGP